MADYNNDGQATLGVGSTLYYVYVMFRPNGVPCYVGKGKGKRWLSMHRAYNPHLTHIIKSNGGKIPSVKIRENLTEQEAHETEMLFIRLLGRDKEGGILVNLTDGGEGQSGWVPNQETREKIRKANTGKSASTETKQKMSIAGKGRPKSAEHKKKIAIGNTGKKMSASAIEKMKESHSQKSRKDALKLRSKHQHDSMTAEQKAQRSKRISEATKIRMQDPIIMAKVKAAALLNYAKRTRSTEGRFI